MEFDKHDKARSILTEVVANFIREEANTNPLITVTGLIVSPDYRNVTILFTTIPDSGQDNALIFLTRKGTELREYVKKHARLKRIPNLEFQIDYGERHRQHIDELTQKIEKNER